MIIKGNLTFTLEGLHRQFTRQPISLYGTYGLPWEPHNPHEHFGKRVAVQITLLTPRSESMGIEGMLTREVAKNSDTMGINFILKPEQERVLQKLIRLHGRYPTDHVRKYPRIPADAALSTFPLRALAFSSRYDNGDTPDSAGVVFDVANLSPSGALIRTENQAALRTFPGDSIDLTLEPRGWYPFPVKTRALVCRTLDQLDPSSGNRVRMLGLRFTRMTNDNEKFYREMLKTILEDIKKRSGGGGPGGGGAGSGGSPGK